MSKGVAPLANSEPVWLIYFVARLYNHKSLDEERRPWNNPTIIPKCINGRADDPRVGRSWDWFYPSHK